MMSAFWIYFFIVSGTMFWIGLLSLCVLLLCVATRGADSQKERQAEWEFEASAHRYGGTD
jgi:hypothetical protein